MKKIIITAVFLAFIITLKAQTPVTLNLPNPCSITGINEKPQTKQNSFDFTVSPNPTAGKFVLDISSYEPIGKVQLQLVNMQGISVLQEQLYTAGQSCVKTLDMSHLPNGIYTLTLTGQRDKRSKKVVLSKTQ